MIEPEGQAVSESKARSLGLLRCDEFQQSWLSFLRCGDPTLDRRDNVLWLYVLAGIDNTATGWGRRDETWSFMDSIGALGGEDWFRLGDRDLALHVERTRRLRLGQTLSEVTTDICRRLGIKARVVPMSDNRVRTGVRVDAGWIDFQDYFVRQQCRPAVHEL